MLTPFIKRKQEPEVAAPVVITYVSCPYCGSIYRVLTLGMITNRLHPEPTIARIHGNEVPNPFFRETHLANPIECPMCRRKYIVFVGVEVNTQKQIRRIHIKIAKPNEPFVKELSKWPHKGIVDKRLIEYTYSRISIYGSIEEYREYEAGGIEASSLEPVTPEMINQPPYPETSEKEENKELQERII